jgi:hypothetical protein
VVAVGENGDSGGCYRGRQRRLLTGATATRRGEMQMLMGLVTNGTWQLFMCSHFPGREEGVGGFHKKASHNKVATRGAYLQNAHRAIYIMMEVSYSFCTFVYQYLFAHSTIQGLKIRPFFLKIVEIRRDQAGPISEKIELFTKKLVLFIKNR